MCSDQNSTPSNGGKDWLRNSVFVLKGLEALRDDVKDLIAGNGTDHRRINERLGDLMQLVENTRGRVKVTAAITSLITALVVVILGFILKAKL